jgi:GTPase
MSKILLKTLKKKRFWSVPTGEARAALFRKTQVQKEGNALMPATQTTRRARQALILAPRLAQSEEVTLVELEKLLRDLGIEVMATVVQRTTPLGSPHLIGTGKLEELKEKVTQLLPEEGSDDELILVVAADITPAEQRTLERTLEIPVMDRSAVILQVFEVRAQTNLARWEVELARARYELPRVRDDQSLGDREGGGGRAARGHSNVELKKQRLKASIADLEARIVQGERARLVQQKNRSTMQRVALVGYTNAGKSSLLRALTGSEVYVADQLFATLSTTARVLPRSSPPVIVSDTVGFMRALPHELLRSFRSTLMEAVEADMRVLVVDASDPHFREQLALTEEVLGDLGADAESQVLAFNKCDRASASALSELKHEFPDACFVSALAPDSVGALRTRVTAFLEKNNVETTVLVPFSDGKRLASLHATTRVLSEVATEDGLEVRVSARREMLERLEIQQGDTGAVVSVAQ